MTPRPTTDEVVQVPDLSEPPNKLLALILTIYVLPPGWYVLELRVPGGCFPKLDWSDRFATEAEARAAVPA